MKTQNLILPVQYPITLAEAKKQVEIDDADTAHDVYVSALIRAATAETEQYLHRRLITQTWKYYLDCWPKTDFFRLPFGRLQSVASIKYTDSVGDETIWDTGEYIVDTESEPGEIKLGYEKIWPTEILYPVNPIKVEFSCGYYIGDTWITATDYVVGDQVMPVTENGLVYQCTTLLTSGGTEPVWPLTIGGTVADDAGIWTCIGIAVPEPIRQAIKIMIADMFEYRETEYFGISHTKFKTIEALLFPYKLFGWII